MNEPMSTERQVVTTVVVLVILIGGTLLALWQAGAVQAFLGI